MCVAKGVDFLGRRTEQGDVFLVSLEDPRNHTDNCLQVLQYDPKHDGHIRIVEKLPPFIEQTVDILGNALAKMPDVRLVVIDTLAKAIRVKDLNEYMPTLAAVEQLRNLARAFPRVHVQGLVHSKKMLPDDPFDGILGSTILRGEPDTNIVLYANKGQRLVEVETRIGRSIPATILEAELAESAGACVVKNFSLGPPFSEWQAEKSAKADKKRAMTYEQRIIEFLLQRNNYVATQETVLEEVTGKRESLIDAIANLASRDVVKITGTKNSKTEPTTLRLNPHSLEMNEFMYKYGGVN